MGFKPPPHKPRPAPEWASYVADRSPQWKVHAGSRGQAVNAVFYSVYGRGARGGTIYRLVNGEWTEYASVPRGAKDKAAHIPRVR